MIESTISQLPLKFHQEQAGKSLPDFNFGEQCQINHWQYSRKRLRSNAERSA